MSSLSSRWRISIGMSAPFSVESALSFLFNLKYILLILLVYLIILKIWNKNFGKNKYPGLSYSMNVPF